MIDISANLLMVYLPAQEWNHHRQEQREQQAHTILLGQQGICLRFAFAQSSTTFPSRHGAKLLMKTEIYLMRMVCIDKRLLFR